MPNKLWMRITISSIEFGVFECVIRILSICIQSILNACHVSFEELKYKSRRDEVIIIADENQSKSDTMFHMRIAPTLNFVENTERN